MTNQPPAQSEPQYAISSSGEEYERPPAQPVEDEARRRFEAMASRLSLLGEMNQADRATVIADAVEALLDAAALSDKEAQREALAEKNQKLSALIVEQEREYHEGRKKLEAQLTERTTNYVTVLGQLAEARKALRENVGDAYNLLTQGELPTQRRQPSAQRIYDRSKAALADTDTLSRDEQGEGR